jgi:translocation and assembly module TamA
MTTQAAENSYQVEITAPAPLKELLQNHLEIIKWRDNARMTPGEWQRLFRAAPQNIEDLLATEGYFSPGLKPSMDESDGTFVAKFQIDPGSPALITTVNLKFSGAITLQPPTETPDIAKLRANWLLQPGAQFRQEDWAQAKRKLLTNLLIERYPNASIRSSKAEINAQTHAVALTVEIDSGLAYRFGGLRIQGLRRYRAEVIENLNPIKPGELYKQSSLLTFQTRLQESGYFRNVEVTADTDPKNADSAPIHVVVEENSAIKVGIGAGYSTNTGARVLLDFNHLNLLDRGWRLTSSLKLEQKEQSISGLIRLPTDSNNYRDSVNAGLLRTSIAGQTTITGHASVNRSWGPWRREQTIGLNYLAEQERLNGADITNTQVVTASYGITLRRTDSEFLPTRGYLFNAQFAVAPFDSLSGGRFLQSDVKVQGYYPLTRRTQLIGRAEAGMIYGTDNAPASFLFRAGGDQSVRGYAYQSLGIRKGDAITGGRYLATGSLEMVQWLTERWGAAVFVDFGNAANHLQALKPVFGYGVGARWKSPIGPLGADIAYGQATGGFHFHFNLGVTF